jgi:hypothetical protein
MYWDVVAGVVFAVLLIGASAFAGRSLDRAQARRRDEERDTERDRDADLFGEF